MAKFSERLRELRKERGLKQREMAEICGLKLRGYQQYEYNESYPGSPGSGGPGGLLRRQPGLSHGPQRQAGDQPLTAPEKDKIRPPLVIKWNETLL